MTERKGIVALEGNPLTLLGEEIKAGQEAPGSKVLDSDLKEFNIEELDGKIRLIASVPSLDTPVCDLQIKRFNDEAAKISKDVVIVFISMDLPFAQKRFCQAYNIKKVKTFSDHRDADFGIKYGVLIKELRLLSRAVFVVDRGNKITYVQYVSELSSQPDHEAALKAVSEAAES